MSNMTQPGYDERYAAMPIEASRRGAHRAKPNPFVGVLPVIGVLIVVVAVVLMAYKLFGGGSGSSDAALDQPSTRPSAAVSQGAGQSVAATPSAGASQGSQPGASTPASAPAPSASAQASTATTGKVDKTLVINYFNGSSPQVPGLSRKAASKITGAGWKQGSVEAWTGEPLTQTTVFYAKPSQKATAEAIVKLLGVGVAQQDATVAAKGVTVVVANDYAGG